MSKTKKGSVSKIKDRTGEAIDWVNSIGYDLAEQKMSEDEMADMAIAAVEQAFEGCYVDRSAVVSSAGVILDNYCSQLEDDN